MEFQYAEEISAEEYNGLRQAVGWERLVPEQAESGLRRAYRTVCCRVDGRAVGFARMLWDGGYIAYLSDVMVLPDFQRRGVGAEMVKRLVAEMKARLQPGWIVKIVLMSAKGKEPFYDGLGFSRRPNELEGAGMIMMLRG